MKKYWCIGKDGAGRSFSVLLNADTDAGMWAKLDSRFGGPVDRHGLLIAEVLVDKEHPCTAKRLVFDGEGVAA